jgi:hypothetical protein
MRLALAAAVLISACAPFGRKVANTYTFEGLSAVGEIRVPPVLHAYDPVPLRTDEYVTDSISARRLALRRERMAELAGVPDAMGLALPGAIHTRLNADWTGHFRVGALGTGGRERLVQALRRGSDQEVEEALAEAARSVGGEAVLFSWIREIRATPITAEAFPGDTVETAVGPVLVAFEEEPYRIDADVGMALVSADGHVILRYEDEGNSLLSPYRTAGRVGRDLAASLAQQVAGMWPDDPHLWQHDLASETRLAGDPDAGLAVPPPPPADTPEVGFEPDRSALRKAGRAVEE